MGTRDADATEVTDEMREDLGKAIDALGTNIAAMHNRGFISAEELAAALLDTVIALKATYYCVMSLETRP